MHWGWLWGAVLLAVGILDVGIRLTTGWSMVWVVRAEAALLLASSVGLLMLYWHRPAQGRGPSAHDDGRSYPGRRTGMWPGSSAGGIRRAGGLCSAGVSGTDAPTGVPECPGSGAGRAHSSGDTTAYHIHADPMVGIAVQDARIRIQRPGSPLGAVASPRATPYVFDNWSQALPYTHRVVNADTLPLHYVVAEWLTRSGPEAPALPDDANRHLVKEGPTTRVYQVALGPGTATEPHIHATPGLVVLATAGSFREEDGGRAEGGTGAGSWSWREHAESHVLRNREHPPHHLRDRLALGRGFLWTSLLPSRPSIESPPQGFLSAPDSDWRAR